MDSITIYACAESPCVNQIAGSPKTVLVTYTILQTAVTFSSTSLDVAGDNQTQHSFLIDTSLGITVTNPGNRQRIRATGTKGLLTQEADADWTTLANGQLRLFLRPPSSFGAGTYTDTVKLELCLNQACSRVASGSPVYLALSYTVTGSELPNIRVSWVASPGLGPNLSTSMTQSPVYPVVFSPSEHAYDPIYTRYSDSTTGLIMGVTLVENISGVQPGRYDVSLQPPAALGSGIFTDSMEFEACFDAACTKPVPNSKYTLSFNKLIPVTEGLEFTRSLVPDISGASEVIWSAANQSLYVASNTQSDHWISQVDPVTMAVGATSTLAGTVLNSYTRTMAATPDGSYLYVGGFTSFVNRLKLPSLELDLAIPLASPAGTFTVRDLATLPGEPASILVTGTKTGDGAGIFVYDDDIVRPDYYLPDPNPPREAPRWLVPWTTPGMFVSMSSTIYADTPSLIDLWSVDASGVHKTSSTSTDSRNMIPKPYRVGTKLYSHTVVDGVSAETIGTLPTIYAYDTVVDEAHSKIYAWGSVNGSNMLVSFDLATLQPLAYMYLSPVYFPNIDTAKVMALWGEDGLAVVNGNQLILLKGTFFSTYRGEPTQ